MSLPVATGAQQPAPAVSTPGHTGCGRGGAPNTGRAVVAEWAAVAVSILIALVLIELPYHLAFAQARRGFDFVGMFWPPSDYSQYAAAMLEGASGRSWLVHDHLTSEPHAAVFMYAPYVALGKLAALCHVGNAAAFQAARMAATAFMLAAVYLFACLFFPEARRRRAALGIIAFSSGISFFLVLAGGGLAWQIPSESLSTELNAVALLFTAPHLILALGWLLLAARAYVLSWSDDRPIHALQAALATLGLATTNAFSLVPLLAVMAAHFVIQGAMQRRSARGPLLCLAATAVVAAPFLAYSFLLFHHDPFWGTVYGSQNVTLSPPLPYLLLHYAPLLLLAGLGLPEFWRRHTAGSRFVLLWILVSVGLTYVPLGYQRRFVFGLQPMLGVVALLGFERLRGLSHRQPASWAVPARRVVMIVLPATLYASSLALYAALLLRAALPPSLTNDTGLFAPAAVVMAGQWLQTASGPDDVVLAGVRTSNYLAGVVPGRVYVGHQSATLGAVAKEEAVKRFFAGSDSAAAAGRLLLAGRIRYVVYGPDERHLGSLGPPAGLALERVYRRDGVDIYRLATAP